MKTATPISHLFENADIAKRIAEVSNCLECRDHSLHSPLPNQEVFHCELQPIQSLSNDELEYLRDIKDRKKELKLISFHLASCYTDPVIVDRKFMPGGKKLSRQQLIENAKINFDIIKSIFGTSVILAVENNNYYRTEAYDFITNSDFISEVVNQNDIKFLYDTSHARISAHNQGVSFDDYVAGLPMDKIVQIHVSRHGFDERNEIMDSHELPGEEEFHELENLIRQYKPRYLTLEYYKDPEKLIKGLHQLNLLINGQ